MALSATLNLRQNQSLVMTPQLMQSIRLLQLTHTELEQYIDREIEKNPLLQRESDDPDFTGENTPEPLEADPATANDQQWWETGSDSHGESVRERLDAPAEDAYPEDSGPAVPDAPELASQWKSMPGLAAMQDDAYHDLDGFAAAARTLRDAVQEQIVYAFPDPAHRAIANDLADQLDEAGYLEADLRDCAGRLGCALADVEAVLAGLQAFEPAGLFARSLSECLAIQLARKNRLDPAMRALTENLELLAKRDFSSLRRLCGVDESDLVEMLAEIRQLDPKPGNRFDTTTIQTIVADVLVRPAANGSWSVELNPETLPRVLVDRVYYAEIAALSAKGKEDLAFLDECMRNANWLTRSLDQRARTIMKVASEIVRQQSDFLHRGVNAMKPLTLRAVADAIDMHESTVSRVTSNKFMQTPRGIFELKFFFTAAIASADGGDGHSSEAVRHRIRQMVDQENADKVLSDDVIVTMLKRDGIDIARRTVAKYRETMNIASSVQRRREKRALARLARAG